MYKNDPNCLNSYSSLLTEDYRIKKRKQYRETNKVLILQKHKMYRKIKKMK